MGVQLMQRKTSTGTTPLKKTQDVRNSNGKGVPFYDNLVGVRLFGRRLRILLLEWKGFVASGSESFIVLFGLSLAIFAVTLVFLSIMFVPITDQVRDRGHSKQQDRQQPDRQQQEQQHRKSSISETLHNEFGGPNRWVESEKKLKVKLKELEILQSQGKYIGVPVLQRWLGDDFPPWLDESTAGMTVDEWKTKRDAKYAEMRNEEEAWRARARELMEKEQRAQL